MADPETEGNWGRTNACQAATGRTADGLTIRLRIEPTTPTHAGPDSPGVTAASGR